MAPGPINAFGIAARHRDAGVSDERRNYASGRIHDLGIGIAEIGIGPINVRNVEAMVLADQALDGALIGMSFLKKLRRFEISGSTLTLQQ